VVLDRVGVLLRRQRLVALAQKPLEPGRLLRHRVGGRLLLRRQPPRRRLAAPGHVGVEQLPRLGVLPLRLGVLLRVDRRLALLQQAVVVVLLLLVGRRLGGALLLLLLDALLLGGALLLGLDQGKLVLRIAQQFRAFVAGQVPPRRLRRGGGAGVVLLRQQV